jgi:hypothetical protein
MVASSLFDGLTTEEYETLAGPAAVTSPLVPRR